jgi:hypothetical protein
MFVVLLRVGSVIAYRRSSPVLTLEISHQAGTISQRATHFAITLTDT